MSKALCTLIFSVIPLVSFANESVHRRPGGVKPATNLFQSVIVPCKANTEKTYLLMLAKIKHFEYKGLFLNISCLCCKHSNELTFVKGF